jgi:hypothetical protein
MEKPTLTKEESDLYLKIVQRGNMDDMFDFAYAVGRARLAEEQIAKLTPPLNSSGDK